MKQIKMIVLMALLVAPALLNAAPLQSLGDYVEGELLVVPKQGGIKAAASSGYKILAKQEGKTTFIRVKTKPGQDMLSAIQALAAQPWVAHVEPNYIYKASALPNDPDMPLYWGLNNTGQTVNTVPSTAGADMSVNKAWDINTDCSTVTVAVIDTGVDYNHPDLAANMWTNALEIAGNGIDDDGNGFIDDTMGWDFVQGDKDPMDFSEHGTHVAGTIGAAGNNGIGGTGVCQTATIMPLRVLGSAGSGFTSDIIAAVNYAVANGAKVINMSLGGGGFSTLMDTAIANANTAGVLVVVAAGNENTNNDTTPSYPASYNQPNIISVAATTQSDGLASFSNFGLTSVDVGAPGTNIRSTVPPVRQPITSCSWNFDNATLQGWTTSTWDTTNATTTVPPVVTTNTVGVTIEKAFSPSYSLTDSPAANYLSNRSYRAVSPACNLTGFSGALLEYQVELDSESGYDFIFVETSKDGVTWTVEDGFSGTTNGSFFPVSTDLQSLDGYASAQVRFRLETDFTITYGGVHVDDINITLPNTTIAAHTASDYAFFNGTSMATPNTAGVAALVWAAEPTLSNIQLKNRLLNNGDAIAALAGKTVTGKRINALMSMPLTAPTGLATQAPSAYTVPMTWIDNATNEVAYEVLRKTGAGLFAKIASVPANTASFADTTALAGTTYTYQVSAQGRDGRLSVPSAIAVATTPANSAPTSVTVSPITAESGIPSALYVATVVDPDTADAHVISIATQGANGTATVSGSSVSYTSNTGFVGTDTFTVKATDKGGLFVTNTASVTVTPVNRAPTSVSISPITTQEGVTSSFAAITVVDPDAGDTHTISTVTQPAHGLAIVVNNSGLQYVPNAGFVGSDTITFKATDQGGLFVTGTVAVTVTAKPVTPPAPQPGGGGGCVMEAQSGAFDPLLPALLLFSGLFLLRRRKNM